MSNTKQEVTINNNVKTTSIVSSDSKNLHPITDEMWKELLGRFYKPNLTLKQALKILNKIQS